jgi:hypothetical protein
MRLHLHTIVANKKVALSAIGEQQCGEQKLRDFEARYLRSLSEYV